MQWFYIKGVIQGNKITENSIFADRIYIVWDIAEAINIVFIHHFITIIS